ncbi:MAG: tRNA-binding protein [Fimbriimonadales bacterium]
MDTIEWADFAKVELRAGTIVAAEPFPEARKSAYKLTVDFGELGIRRSSAQITALYAPDELVGLQVVGVVNFPPKRIAGFESECLITGFPDANGNVVLVMPTHTVPNGSKLF